MKKILLILSLLCGYSIHAKAQNLPIDRELLFDIENDFITSWEYFRMRKNPFIPDEEKYDGRSWKRPNLLPDTFWIKNYWPEVKVYRWEDVYKRPTDRYHRQVRNPFMYVIEKGNGIMGIKREFMTRKPLDTLQLNVYDSIFPYDNRFLIYHNGDKEPNKNKFLFYSGNVDWEPFDRPNSIGGAGFVRGVQFGVERVKDLGQDMIDSIKKLRPEYPDYVYATADESFLSKGKILIAGHENTISDYIEYIFYTDDSTKTGDKEYEYYEIRYVLPTVIKSITERRMIKRKLTEDEINMIRRTYLRFFTENVSRFTLYFMTKDDEIIDE
jgi:hypothetical protein